MNFQTIVTGTDLSPASMSAVRHACQLAKQFDAQLHIVHVAMLPFVEYMEQVQTDFSQSIDDCERQHVDASRRQLQSLDTAPMPPDRVTREVLQGIPVEQLLKYATSHSADLLVLGTHGYSGLRHALLGSTAERLVREARCPVLTIRHEDSTTEQAA
ncbi:MAG: universal stress protein [Planctomycetaceae bacterium]|nr:universal stress protein [Planctomycetaceae bacterium]